jgi:hypothetical protein
MTVTSISTNTLTVTRAVEGTTATSHSDGVTVKQVLTASALDQIKLDANIAGISGNSGQSALGSDFTGTAASGTYQDTGLSVTLPSAGTYLLIGACEFYYQKNSASNIQVEAILYDGTSALGGNTSAYTDGAGLVLTPGVLHAVYAASASTTIKMRLARITDNTGSATGALLGSSTISWVKLS